MSTAQEIIEYSLGSVGKHSPQNPASTDLLNDCLPYLRGLIHELELDSILLRQLNSDGVTYDYEITDEANVTTLAQELNEPPAATQYLAVLLLERIAPLVLIPLDGMILSRVGDAQRALESRYKTYTIPSKRPSKLLPRGQGGKRDRIEQTFWQGEAIANDYTSS
jgi:hypothetical protein